MRIYLIRRTDTVGYDEYDAHVVYARNPKEVREMAKTKAGRYGEDSEVWDTAKVTLVGAAPRRKPSIILSSFNAG